MGEIRVKDLASKFPSWMNDYFLIDSEDGCHKISLAHMFKCGELQVASLDGQIYKVTIGGPVTFNNTQGLAIGSLLTVGGRNLLVLGKINDTNNDALIIVGNGTLDEFGQPVPSNILEFDKNGNLTIKGDLVHDSKSLSAEISRVEKSIMYDITNYVIETTDWVLEGTPTYADYPYRAEIYLGSELGDYLEPDEDFIADIVPSAKMVDDGLVYSLITTDVDYTIYIYASSVPEDDYTIPLISCRKVNEVE